MRTTLGVMLLLVLLGAALSHTVAPPATAEERGTPSIDWLLDLDEARAKARETGRPILAVFR